MATLVLNIGSRTIKWAVLGGLDGIAFTGRIGKNSAMRKDNGLYQIFKTKGFYN